MYKFVSILIIFFNTLPNSSYALSNQCKNLLTFKSSSKSELNETTVKTIKILERMKELKVITDQHYFDHAKEDLLNTDKVIKEKMRHEAFRQLFDKWTAVIDKSLSQFDNYDGLTDEEKKLWKNKLELVGKFAVSQFVTFVEAERKIKAEPLYKKQNQILEHIKTLPSTVGFKVFSFELERQIKRFFSILDIISCKF